MVENPILEAADDVALADRMKTSRDRMVAELGKVIVGQDEVIEQVLVALFAGGHMPARRRARAWRRRCSCAPWPTCSI